MNKLNEYIEVLKGFKRENRLYWLEALVKQGKLLKSEAGYLIIYFNLI